MLNVLPLCVATALSCLLLMPSAVMSSSEVNTSSVDQGVAAPAKKKQAAGFHRMKLGAFEVVTILDGTLFLPAEQLLHGMRPPQILKALARYFLKSPVETSVSGFLIDTGSKRVLIDTGASSLYGPGGGGLVSNLRAAGYTPEMIDEIYITHAHSDHIGGLVAGKERVFPNAILRLDQHDIDFWLSQEELDRAAEARKATFRNAQACIGPYAQAGKLKPFEGEVELVPGIRSVNTHGHTPGHTSYAIESGEETLLIVGDLIHVAAIQFDRPDLTILFDSDEKAARKARHRVFREVAKMSYWLAGPHLSFPAIGHIRAHGSGYSWYPINYSAL